MIKVLLKAKDYKQFINQMLENPLYGRGAKTRLAGHLKVQSSFISLVLSGPQDFSSEHAIRIAEFFKLSPVETEFFVTLLQRDRAGSPALRDYHQKILDRMIAACSSRVQIQSREIVADEGDLSQYYGNWYNAALHMAIHHPRHRTVPALVEWTGLKELQVREGIELLVRLGFAKFDRDKVLPADRRFHFAKKSPALRSHHINWRHQAVQSLDTVQPDSIHYSLVMNVDRETVQKIREMVRDCIRRADQHLERSTVGTVHAFCLDVFEVF